MHFGKPGSSKTSSKEMLAAVRDMSNLFVHTLELQVQISDFNVRNTSAADKLQSISPLLHRQRQLAEEASALWEQLAQLQDNIMQVTQRRNTVGSSD